MGQVIAQGNDRFIWDPWGRLITVTNDTYNWSASYDALGRRLKTSYTSLKNDAPNPSQQESVIATSFYDPEEEFQEISINYDSKTFWKLCKDNSCDVIIDEEGNTVTLVYDIRGNLSAIVSSQEIVWNQDKPSAYGPLNTQSIKPELFSIAQAHSWQSHRVDPTGLIWLGARYYNPCGSRFLSPDPVSYPLCLDLYAYANGDPINYFDPDGRFASSVYKELKSFTVDMLNSHRVQGGVCAAAGFGEFLTGSVLACTPGGFTQVSGYIVATHGLDNLMAGCYQFCDNKPHSPATVQLLQKAGMSYNAAHMINDAGMGVATMGASALNRATMRTVAPSFRTTKEGMLNGPGCSAANAVRLKNSLIAREIANGHAFEKHVLNQGEFPGLIRTREQFSKHVENILNNPSAVKQLRNNRVGYWHQETGTVIIRNQRALDGGTAFQPRDGFIYFNEILR